MADNICAVILASGSSKRMGKNKLLLSVAEKTLIQSSIDACRNSQLRDVLVVSCYEEIAEICRKNKVKFAQNSLAHLGQSESIKIGVNFFQKSDAIMFVNADTPRINPDYIDSLVHTYNKEILVPHYCGEPMTPVIFPSKYFKDLLELQGDIGGKNIIKANKSDRFDSSFENFDIDTKADYERACEGLEDAIR